MTKTMFKCSQCGKIVESGYVCSTSHEFWCPYCEFSNKFCEYAKNEKKEAQGFKLHEHNPMPTKEGKIDPEIYKQICYNQYIMENKKI